MASRSTENLIKLTPLHVKPFSAVTIRKTSRWLAPIRPTLRAKFERNTLISSSTTALQKPENCVSPTKRTSFSGAALALTEYAQQCSSRNDAIRAAYASGGYTLKEVGDYFQLHYSRVSKIVAKRKT